MVPSQDSNPRPVNRKCVALLIAPARHRQQHSSTNIQSVTVTVSEYLSLSSRTQVNAVSLSVPHLCVCDAAHSSNGIWTKFRRNITTEIVKQIRDRHRHFHQINNVKVQQSAYQRTRPTVQLFLSQPVAHEQ